MVFFITLPWLPRPFPRLRIVNTKLGQNFPGTKAKNGWSMCSALSARPLAQRFQSHWQSFRCGSDSSVRASRTSGPLKKPTTLDPVPGSLRAYDNADLRKLREGQRDKISITALAAKRVYTGADIGAGVANTLRPARSTTAFEGAAVIMEIGRAPLSR